MGELKAYTNFYAYITDKIYNKLKMGIEPTDKEMKMLKQAERWVDNEFEKEGLW